jgi:hypothetical protein
MKRSNRNEYPVTSALDVSHEPVAMDIDDGHELAQAIVDSIRERLMVIDKKGNLQRTNKPDTANKSTLALDQQQTVTYIANMALGLRRLAYTADLAFLTYLLDMVVQEGLTHSEWPSKFRDQAPSPLSSPFSLSRAEDRE